MSTRGEPSGGGVREVARLFTKLGFIAFGGPAAHIALMHDEVVRRRGWLDDTQFLDLVGATNLIPGPNSTEMAMHIGHVRARTRGLVVAGTAFILPAAAIVLTLAWAYVAYGDTPPGEGLLYGVKPVIIAIIVHALVRLGRTAMTGRLVAAVGLGALVSYLAGVNELLVVVAGGGTVLLARATRGRGAATGLAWLPSAALHPVLAQAGDGVPVDLGWLFGVFLKVGAVLYGSGYVLLAFLRGDLVTRLGWLTETQLLDAVAVGQFTPGPVFTTATFVGYVVAGLPGALLATVGIFLPSFLFVGLLTKVLPKVRDRAWTATLLDGVNAAALGLMAGVCWQLGRDALVDPLTVGLAVAALAVLLATKINSSWLVGVGAVVGLAAVLT